MSWLASSVQPYQHVLINGLFFLYSKLQGFTQSFHKRCVVWKHKFVIECYTWFKTSCAICGWRWTGLHDAKVSWNSWPQSCHPGNAYQHARYQKIVINVQLYLLFGDPFEPVVSSPCEVVSMYYCLVVHC